MKVAQEMTSHGWRPHPPGALHHLGSPQLILGMGRQTMPLVPRNTCGLCQTQVMGSLGTQLKSSNIQILYCDSLLL